MFKSLIDIDIFYILKCSQCSNFELTYEQRDFTLYFPAKICLYLMLSSLFGSVHTSSGANRWDWSIWLLTTLSPLKVPGGCNAKKYRFRPWVGYLKLWSCHFCGDLICDFHVTILQISGFKFGWIFLIKCLVVFQKSMLATKLFVRCAVFIVDKVQSTSWEHDLVAKSISLCWRVNSFQKDVKECYFEVFSLMQPHQCV